MKTEAKDVARILREDRRFLDEALKQAVRNAMLHERTADPKS